MIRGAAVAAGEIVIVLLGLFLLLLLAAVVLLISGHQDSALAQSVLTWAGGTFFALLGVLGVKRVTDTGSTLPPGASSSTASVTTIETPPAVAPELAAVPVPATSPADRELESMQPKP